MPAGTAADVDRAVAAARAAFPRLGGTAAGRARRAPRPAARGAGRPRRTRSPRTIALRARARRSRSPRRVQAGLPLTVLRAYADLAGHGPPSRDRSATRWSCASRSASSARSPRGTTRCTRSWPRSAAALAAGCTVVLKPSELTPLVAYLLFDAVDEAGLPPGVLNLVTGTGPVVGRGDRRPPRRRHGLVHRLHRDRRARSRTLAADRIARVALELGGKSANVILDDADLATAVKVGVGNAFLNSGQTCTAWTRMLVHRDRYDEAVDAGRQGRRRLPARRPVRPRPPGSARWSPPRSGTGSAATSSAASPTAPGWSPAGRTPRCRTAATSSPPTVLADVDPDSDGRPGGDLRPGARRSSRSTTTTRRSRSPTTPGTAWPAASGRPTRTGRSPWPGGMRTGAVDINGGGVQPARPVRRLQAVRHRPRARRARAGRVPARSRRSSDERGRDVRRYGDGGARRRRRGATAGRADRPARARPGRGPGAGPRGRRLPLRPVHGQRHARAAVPAGARARGGRRGGRVGPA